MILRISIVHKRKSTPLLDEIELKNNFSSLGFKELMELYSRTKPDEEKSKEQGEER